MSYDLLLALSVSNGPLAKGRGSSGSSENGSIDDGWEADPLTKAIVVAYFIWFFVTLIQIGFIFKRIRNVQTRASKGPFIFMTVVMLNAAINFILMGIFYRVQDLVISTTLDGIFYAAEFFSFFYTAFLPGVVLYLLHVRSDITGQQQQAPMFMSQKRKRAFDWALIGLIYLLFLVFFGWQIADYSAYRNAVTTGRIWYDSTLQRANLSHAILAFQFIAYLDVVVSSIVMYKQLKRCNTPDPVVTRIMWGIPIFFLLFTIRWILTNIWQAGLTPSGFSLIAAAFVDGIASIAIAALFLWVMTFPGVQWTPLAGGGADQNTPYTIQPPQNWQMGTYQTSAAPAPYNLMSGWQTQPQPAVQYSSWNGSATWKPQETLAPLPSQQQQQPQPIVQYFSWNGSSGSQPQQQQPAAQFYALPLQNQSQPYMPPSHPPPGKQ
ncbi:hypothetical protein CPB86DRAFT_815157 [Serendipita vermifera]|nr:hypothetical protein CPB86DRAFT_815157 [Serendipita vermifera]